MAEAGRIWSCTRALCFSAAGAEARPPVGRAGDDGQRQADPRKPRHRHPAGGTAFLLSRRARPTDGQRSTGDGAAWRLRPGDSVELPPLDAGVEGRACDCRREYRGAETGGVHIADGAVFRRYLPAGGHAAGGREHRHGGWSGRRDDRRARGCRQGRLYRLDRGGPPHSRSDRRSGQGVDLGAGRQGAICRL